MQRIGRVIHVSSNRNLIVKADKRVPKMGEKVVDEKLRKIGTIFDIFGPVSSPYIAVKPEFKNPETLINQTLYVIPSVKKRRG